jgi:GNAT superfamily N-acetyltransferase
VDYPARREVDLALRDGSTVHVRPVRDADRPELEAFLERLSIESRYLRFFSGSVNVDAESRRFADVDYRDRYGIVATTGPDSRVVAHAMYVKTAPERAEVAFAVADAMQGHGLGTLMVAHLA